MRLHFPLKFVKIRDNRETYFSIYTRKKLKRKNESFRMHLVSQRTRTCIVKIDLSFPLARVPTLLTYTGEKEREQMTILTGPIFFPSRIALPQQRPLRRRWRQRRCARI